VTVVVFALGAIALALFYAVERAKERAGRSPLFEFGQLQHKGYRYGLTTSVVVAMGQLGLIFVLPVVLQDGAHLSAARTGLWLVPFGLFIIVGAQLGGTLAHRLATTTVVRGGLVLESVGLVGVALAVSPRVSLLGLLPGFAVFGIGYGFAASQLVNVILSDVPRDKAGVAGAANTTGRQVGAALGVAVMGALLSTQVVHNATHALARSSLPAAVRTRAAAQIRAQGVSYVPSASAPHDLAVLRHTMSASIASSARPALLFAAAVALAGAMVALLIPNPASTTAVPEPVVDEAVGDVARAEVVVLAEGGAW
jgi:predicted MFS family arabinose efflux permease